MRMSMLARFLMRWLGSSIGLWVAAALMSSHISYGDSTGAIIGAGFILAVLNMLIRPILVILSLPAIILSLGLFMLVINGLTVYLASALYAPLHITSFWAAIVAGIIIGLVNYLITAILEEKRHDNL